MLKQALDLEWQVFQKGPDLLPENGVSLCEDFECIFSDSFVFIVSHNDEELEIFFGDMIDPVRSNVICNLIKTFRHSFKIFVLDSCLDDEPEAGFLIINLIAHPDELSYLILKGLVVDSNSFTERCQQYSHLKLCTNIIIFNEHCHQVGIEIKNGHIELSIAALNHSQITPFEYDIVYLNHRFWLRNNELFKLLNTVDVLFKVLRLCEHEVVEFQAKGLIAKPLELFDVVTFYFVDGVL